MWICSKCREMVEDSFDACWKCGTTKEGEEDPAFRAAADGPKMVPDGAAKTITPLACARCKRTLEYVGRKRFHEGANWGVFGELGELFVKREHFDVYVCPRCGQVEFFVDGIGEEYRPH